MIKAVIVHASTMLPVEVRELDGSLESLQKLVGGSIEYVTVGSVAFIVNEEGKIKGMPVNPVATEYLYSIEPAYRGHDAFVGPVIIVGEVDGETISVPESVLQDFNLG